MKNLSVQSQFLNQTEPNAIAYTNRTDLSVFNFRFSLQGLLSFRFSSSSSKLSVESIARSRPFFHRCLNIPRYYCDYCDTYLTHDSPSVRKQHNAGYKHKANVRTYYQQFKQELSQTMLDQKIKQHLVQAGPYQPIGAAYNQHFAGMPGRPPLMPFPRPGMPQMMHMPMRPPILPVPVHGTQSYPSAPPNMPQMGAQPGPPPLPPQMNGVPQSQMAAPGSSEAPTSTAPPGMYQTSNPVPQSSGGYEDFGASN